MSDTYRDLKAWQSAMALALGVYRATASFPKNEAYGLVSQMRRAAVSVPSNIAEGKGRFSQRELLQFLYRARGSLLELETQITIASELDYFDKADAQTLAALISETARLLHGLIKAFQSMCNSKDHPAPAETAAGHP